MLEFQKLLPYLLRSEVCVTVLIDLTWFILKRSYPATHISTLLE